MRAATAAIASVAIASAAVLTGCSGGATATDSGASSYTTAQTAVFHGYLPYAYAVLVNTKVPYGGVIEPDLFATDAQWQELEREAQRSCDLARAQGWPTARAALRGSLQDARKAGIDTSTYVTALVASATTQGSYCHDLAAGALPVAHESG